MKILEEKDSYEAIATLGSWLGKDSYEYTKNLGKYVYEQLDNTDNCGTVQWYPEGNQGNYTFFPSHNDPALYKLFRYVI